MLQRIMLCTSPASADERADEDEKHKVFEPFK